MESFTKAFLLSHFTGVHLKPADTFQCFSLRLWVFHILIFPILFLHFYHLRITWKRAGALSSLQGNILSYTFLHLILNHFPSNDRHLWLQNPSPSTFQRAAFKASRSKVNHPLHEGNEEILVASYVDFQLILLLLQSAAATISTSPRIFWFLSEVL